MKRLLMLGLLLFTVGCAGFNKDCAQTKAGMFGSDWIVAQYRADGSAFHCWQVRNASVSSSEGGNINWQDPQNGHLVHITGWENRVQVVNGDFDTAARLLGVDAAKCGNGVYPAP
jgi:hypothetical protein